MSDEREKGLHHEEYVTVQIILRSVIGILIGAMSLITIVNVICRYLFNFSLTWAAEAGQYCMVWGAFLSIAVLVFREEHLTVDLFPRSLRGYAAKALRVFILIGSLCFFVAITYLGVRLVLETRHQVVSSIRFLPMNLIYSIIPASGSLMILGTLVRIVQEFRRKEEGKP